MSFIRHRRATSPNKFEYRNYDSKTQHFDTSAVEAVIKLVMEYNPNAIMVINQSIQTVIRMIVDWLLQIKVGQWISGLQKKMKDLGIIVTV